MFILTKVWNRQDLCTQGQLGQYSTRMYCVYFFSGTQRMMMMLLLNYEQVLTSSKTLPYYLTLTELLMFYLVCTYAGVCVCVCVCVCAHACAYMRCVKYVLYMMCTCVCVHACVRACVHAFMHTCVCMHICTSGALWSILKHLKQPSIYG